MARRGNNEGTIYERADGRWIAQISYWAGGRRRRKSVYGKTRGEVQRKLREVQNRIEDGLPPGDDRITVAQFLNQWLASIEPTVRPKTHARYEQLVRLHAVPNLGRIRLQKLTPAHVQELYADRLAAGLAPRTVVQLHRVLHRALGEAARWGMTPRNVASLVTPPRIERREMRALDAEQSQRFLEAAKGDRLEALYVLALTTGARQGELLGLKWSDIQLSEGMMQIRRSLQEVRGMPVFQEPKTQRSRRQVQLSQRAVVALRQHRARQAEEHLQLGPGWEDHDLVFPNELGRPMNCSNMLRRSFKPLLRRAELPAIRFHDLRHTAATLLLLQGVHVKVVSEMLGHASISLTLDTYSHVLPTMQREAAAAFDRLLGM